MRPGFEGGDLFDRQRAVGARHVLPFFQADPTDGLFSVVPVKVADHRFLFSAGHCFDDVAENPRLRPWLLGGPVVAPVLLDEIVTLRNIPAATGGLATAGGRVDAGVLQVFPIDEAKEVFDHAAVPLDRMRIVHQRDLSASQRVSVIGFPGAGASGTGGTLLTPLFAAGLPADGVEEPVLFPARDWRLDLAFPLERARNAYGNAGELPILRGVSGGAYWLDDERDGLVLIGTHARSIDEELVHDGEHYRCLFGSTLHAHFAIVLRWCPELRDEILVRWPQIAAFRFDEVDSALQRF